MNQQVKKTRILGLHPWWVLGGILLVAFVVFVIVANRLNWQWTGFTGSKLWDWLKYLIIPMTLAIAPILWASLRQSQHRQRAWSRWRIIWIAFLVILLVAFVILLIGGYRWGWDWTGFKGNTLWDWMSLLFLPVALMVATVWFNTRKNQQANASHGVQDITPSQKRALLTLIPTELLPAKPSLPSFTTVPIPTTLASQPRGRRPFSFSISRRAVLAYLAIAILIVGSVASEYWNVFVNKDHPVASSTSAHTIDGYDAAIANGVMLGYNVQHTRVDPYEKDITPVTVLQLEEKWRIPTGGTIKSAATVANGTVFISSSNGEFYAINATRGTVNWPKGIGSNDFGNAPTVAKGVVYLGAPDHYLYALDASTKKVKWGMPTGNRIGSSPTLVNGVIYIGSDDGCLYAFRASDGKRLWKYPVNPSSPIRSSPAVAKGLVYVGSDNGKLYVIHASSGTPAWSYRTGNKVRSTPSVVDGIIYVGSDDGKLYAFRAAGCGRKSCSPLWTAPTGKSIESSPIIANGVLFIGSDDDNLYAYAAAGCRSMSCQPLWSFPTEGSVVSSPVVANGFVYVGADDHNNPNNGYLYAFGLSRSV